MNMVNWDASAAYKSIPQMMQEAGDKIRDDVMDAMVYPMVFDGRNSYLKVNEFYKENEMSNEKKSIKDFTIREVENGLVAEENCGQGCYGNHYVFTSMKELTKFIRSRYKEVLDV